ncbi:MAG: hypothetical protein FJ095_01250 [Deltaproteobacteria bacterium]|nr:hypothetical protein [Deltaproteobacteria bacterium]
MTPLPIARRTTRRCSSLAAVATVLAVAACGGEQELPPEAPCVASGTGQASVVTFATFARKVEGAGVEGVDVDAIVSDGSDEAGCYKADFTSPEGIPGIDNQVSTLLPLVEELVGADNIDALLGAAITNGQLIILVTVRGVDDFVNDSCVDVAFGAGAGAPLLDGAGNYLPYQTFGWDLDTAAVSTLQRGRIEDGVLLAGPGDVELPVRVLDANFKLGIHQTRVRMNLARDDDGGGAELSGFVGGGIVVEELAKVIESFNIGEQVKGAVVPLLKTRADLAMDADGNCRQISAALRFATTPAYVIGE